MSITPRGMSVQEAYRLYRDGNLLVNRRYQRKLVWTEQEKARLIDSILKGFPIPLILLAERSQIYGSGKYEIIDGVQRFNAVFSYIENYFPLDDGRYFDVLEFTRAKQAAESGVFEVIEDDPRLSQEECADLLDYQLAVTIFPTTEESETTEVFGRINSSGKQLSAQEKRQAGVVTPFAEMVRKIAAELRGDASKEVLLLSEMPEISIESKRQRLGYGLRAEETFWCKQGVLWVSQLRDSEDEEMIADIAASLLLGEPFPRSRERLDELYEPGSELFEKVERALTSYPPERLFEEIKVTFSVLRETIETYNSEPNCLRKVVTPGSGNPIKTAFYAIFMAFYELLVHQEQSPDNPSGMMGALTNLHQDLTPSAHYTKTEDRVKNVDKTIGLIQKFFVKREPSVLRHGPGLALDFENSLRRSRIETPRYEFKQGLLRLSPGREFDDALIQRIIETICGIANLGPDANGYVFIGVADVEKDANKVQQLDGVDPVRVGNHFVVGVEREVSHLKITLEDYLNRMLGAIRSSQLSDTLKMQVLTQVDVVKYRGLSVIRITIPAQQQVSFVDKQAFARDGSSTVRVDGPDLIAINGLFQKG